MWKRNKFLYFIKIVQTLTEIVGICYNKFGFAIRYENTGLWKRMFAMRKRFGVKKYIDMPDDRHIGWRHGRTFLCRRSR